MQIQLQQLASNAVKSTSAQTQDLQSDTEASSRRRYWLEVKVFESKVSLHDASGLHSRAQDILLGGDVAGLADPLQVVQVAEQNNHEFNKNWRHN